MMYLLILYRTTITTTYSIIDFLTDPNYIITPVRGTPHCSLNGVWTARRVKLYLHSKPRKKNNVYEVPYKYYSFPQRRGRYHIQRSRPRP